MVLTYLHVCPHILESLPNGTGSSDAKEGGTFPRLVPTSSNGGDVCELHPQGLSSCSSPCALLEELPLQNSFTFASAWGRQASPVLDPVYLNFLVVGPCSTG